MTRRLSKTILIPAAFGFCLLLLPALVVLAAEQEDFDTAKRQNTLEAWQSFLDKYPKGRNISPARKAFDEVLYEQAKSADGKPQELAALFRRAKTSECADKIFALWEAASWRQAQALDAVEAYRNYLLRFPGGKHVDDAKSGIEELAWLDSQRKGSREAYEQYLSEYPRGSHAKEARDSIDELAWSKCQQDASREAYAQYLKEHPSGKHAEESRKILEDLDYKQARQLDTIAAYENFLKSHYGHTEAGKRLRQLMYDKAVQTGALEDWIAFFDKYRYSSWKDDGKDIDQMKENAEKEIERLLYEQIITNPTLESCEDYFRRYRDGPHKQQVLIKMEPCLFDHALKENKVETYFTYLEKYPEGYRDNEIKPKLDALIFTKLDKEEDFRSFERYMRMCPDIKASLLARMEPLMFEWAASVKTVESYEKYLSTYPDGAHLEQVRTSLDPLLFKKAQEEDWYSSYASYIEKCPNGANVQKAEERLSWLKANKAVFVVDYPKQVEATTSPYSNVSSPFWPLTITFKETGGKMGYKLKQGTRYYYADSGTWYSSGGTTVEVKPGGTETHKTWWSSGDHKLCNGRREVTWTGEDAGGHKISVKVSVKGSHMLCTGRKK